MLPPGAGEATKMSGLESVRLDEIGEKPDFLGFLAPE
jgi:hypothetical protein